MGSPTLLLLDEPLEGLAPIIVDILMAAFLRLREEEGQAMVLVEQHAKLALDMAPRAIVLDRGRIAYDGPSGDLKARPETLAALLAVG
jgi:branched-chain amino acid transport system ATP-binding protein